MGHSLVLYQCWERNENEITICVMSKGKKVLINRRMQSSFYLLSNGFTIKYSKKNVKIYIKINIKSAATCFG